MNLGMVERGPSTGQEQTVSVVRLGRQAPSGGGTTYFARTDGESQDVSWPLSCRSQEDPRCARYDKSVSLIKHVHNPNGRWLRSNLVSREDDEVGCLRVQRVGEEGRRVRIGHARRLVRISTATERYQMMGISQRVIGHDRIRRTDPSPTE